jgi:hypothetical protein
LTSIIDILIRATWTGGQAAKQARRDVEGIETGSKKAASGLESFASKAVLAGTAIGIVTVAASKAYDALERGAGLELTTQRFDRLAESIGTTGDALRGDLSQATAGLVSDARQMALVTDLIALGLANTEDEAVRLARVVSELDQDTGELALALVNQTTRRFDQLNVSAVGFEERLAALEDQGLETQAAFTEAFLQQAEAQIERVGGVSGTAAGELKQMEAAFDNVKDAAAGAVLDIVRFAGGFEDIDDATEGLNALADKIEQIGDNYDRLLLVSRLIGFIANPTGGADDFYESIIALQEKLSAGLEEYLTQNEDYQSILDQVVVALEKVEDIIGIEIIGNMERAVEEAESFDRALMMGLNTAGQLANELGKIADAFPSRGGSDRGGGADGRSGGDRPVETFGTIQERVDLFQEFQDDITAITTGAQQERANIEEQYESQRTSTIANYNRQRAEEEEDWQRRQLRQEQDLQRDIAEIQQEANEAGAGARERANDRIVDLERDHLRRMQDIIDNANRQLTEAASRLDAGAVARIQRERDAALGQENQSYTDQLQEIQQDLDRQIEAIQQNSAQRIEEMEQFHSERQQREEEDRNIRLRRQEEAHRQELSELDKQRRDRLQQLKEQIRQERSQRELQYIEERRQLTDHWQDKYELQAEWQASILEQERLWWGQRAALVGDGSAGGGTTAGGDGGAGANGDQRPGRNELLDMVKELSLGAGYTEAFVKNIIDAMRSWTDRQIAIWLERSFGIDIPGYKAGTPYVPQTGLAWLHEGEGVLTKEENARRNGGNRSINIHPGAIQITATPTMDEQKVGRVVVREITRMISELGN